MKGKVPGAGHSSFNLVEKERLLAELPLKEGGTFLDLGCGRGEYALMAAEILGFKGRVVAVDLWEEGIQALKEQARLKGLNNIRPLVGDIGQRLPLEEDSIDLAFMATVLHDLVQTGAADRALREVVRVLKAEGRLAVVEFKKIEGPPGPPMAIRLSPEEVVRLAASPGFRSERVREVGPYNYLVVFRPPAD